MFNFFQVMDIQNQFELYFWIYINLKHYMCAVNWLRIEDPPAYAVHIFHNK